MSGHGHRSRGRLISTVTALALATAACSSTADGSPPTRTGEPPTDRIPIIVDADFDVSDIAAVAILLRDPAVDVRAITISGTGLVHCQAGRLMTRYLIDELGAGDIPFGCGRESGGTDAHPFPEAWRAAADDAFGLDIPPQAEAGVPRDAVDVIRAAVDDSPSAPTIVALGPLTNLEDAFAADDTLADRLAGVHAMLGTVEAPGNVMVNGMSPDDPLEWNAYADPSAVSALFASDVPVSIVPLDATDDVPVPPDLATRLESDHKAGGADLVYELLIRYPDRVRPDSGQQLWDELAALTVSDPDLVEWEDTTVTVGPDGRLVEDESGKTLRFAASADRAAVEATLLEALRRGEPRATPFSVVGSIAVTFDGSTCSVTGTSEQPGVHELRYAGPDGTPSGAGAVGIRAPQDWDDLRLQLPAIDPDGPLPEWLSPGPFAVDADGTGEPVVAAGALDEDVAGVFCFSGTWPSLIFVPGRPVQVGAGAIGAT
ncbi:MAG TPA: nucleoside hydrolase [Candidatus Limnocylindrales bacterium]|nr:nucleoside hydrolase [Candidatus Limnocylindrales bacterium]